MNRSSLITLVILSALLAGCSTPDRKSTSVPTVTPIIIRTIPHDSTAFTQGLVFRDGKLYESTGAPSGTGSSIRVIDPAKGAILKNTPVPGVFAEGLAIAGNTMMQLTWRDHVAFVYSFPACEKTAVIRYDGEGWGLAWDGSAFVMSNGSDTLYYRNPRFAIVKKVPVRHLGRPLRNLNELEYRDGLIFANVWYSNFIFVIDPAKGTVTKVIDCSDLVRQAGTTDENAVLNGIAFNDGAGTFYLTGKNWKWIFEVRIP